MKDHKRERDMTNNNEIIKAMKVRVNVSSTSYPYYNRYTEYLRSWIPYSLKSSDKNEHVLKHEDEEIYFSPIGCTYQAADCDAIGYLQLVDGEEATEGIEEYLERQYRKNVFGVLKASGVGQDDSGIINYETWIFYVDVSDIS